MPANQITREKTAKMGDCFFVALQLIQDYGTAHDNITRVMVDHGVGSDSPPQLVHAHVSDGSKQFTHAWVQVGEWAVDLSNGTSNVRHIDSYTHIHQVHEPKSFDRDTVLAILHSNPTTPFWTYGIDELDQIRKKAAFLNGQWPPRIDFLQAFHENRNPLELLKFPKESGLHGH